jgi:hypothetical protein
MSALAHTLAAATPPPDGIESLYRAITTASFALLGLWWVVVTTRYARGEGSALHRRHAYGIALFFLLPAIMSLIASVNGELSLLWRVAFGLSAGIGLVEVVLYLATGGARTAGALLLRGCGLVLYALIAVVAARPQLAADLGTGLHPQELESVLLGALLFVGAHLVWLALTEPAETAGA